MKRSAAVLLSILLALTAVMAGASQASAHPYCGIQWGSLAKNRSTGSAAEMVGVRAGQHRCFDRLVLDFEGDVRGYFVSYVRQVREDGSGKPVPVAGGARLEVVATAPTRPTDAIFTGSGRDVVDVRGYRTFRQVAYAGSFEGNTTIALGVRARLPFRVFILDGPGSRSRLVVDVAHRW